MLDVLVIAPHPDDAEFAMGGAILKMKAEGLRVGILDLTDGEPTPFGSKEIRRRETEAATQILGLDWRSNLGLPNRSLEPTLEARAKLAGVLRTTRANCIFCPYWEDTHPDHTAATQLIEAARFWAKLTKTDLPGEPFHPQRVIYYFCTHIRKIPEPSFVVDISAFWEKKLAAVRCYASQLANPPSPSGSGASLEEQIEYRARMWGWTVGTQYGEPFAVREVLRLADFRAIL
ncbi:bacillithiol biosynthesis deacetylase BshB1 [Thermopirellula anaerolimosa]